MYRFLSKNPLLSCLFGGVIGGNMAGFQTFLADSPLTLL